MSRWMWQVVMSQITQIIEDLVESSPIQYHLAPCPQFENVENFGNVVASD